MKLAISIVIFIWQARFQGMIVSWRPFALPLNMMKTP